VENTRLFLFLERKDQKKNSLDGFVGDFPESTYTFIMSES
jgi:hypothetical protein